MSLYASLHITGRDAPVSLISIGRLQALDLSDKDAVADVVSDYRVRVDGRVAGTVQHRYGDGAHVLLRKALELITE